MEETSSQRRHRLLIEKLELGLSRVKKGWVQGKYAVDELGRESPPSYETTVKWGIDGAVSMGASMHDIIVRKHAMSELGKTVGLHHPDMGGSAMNFNNAEGRTQEEVIELFEKTLARVREEGPRE